MHKPGIDDLLVRSAMDEALLARLRSSPDDVFAEYDLTPEQQDSLRSPDARLLGLFGQALQRQSEVARAASATAGESRPVVVQGRSLPDVSLVVTIVPCVVSADGETRKYSYAVWVNPLPEGADPEMLPPPQGIALPGTPMNPLHVVVQLSAVEMADSSVGLWAYLRRSTNVLASSVASDPLEVQKAADAVRTATVEDRYARLVDLLRTLQAA